MLKHSSQTAGFTLIELMIVVAIIGILSAVALPQFSHFLVKSRRAEAFIGLGGFYSAEISFKADKGYFTLSPEQAGFAMDGQATPFNGNCVAGSLVTCGKYFSYFVVVATTNTIAMQAWGYPDPQAGADTFITVFP